MTFQIGDKLVELPAQGDLIEVTMTGRVKAVTRLTAAQHAIYFERVGSLYVPPVHVGESSVVWAVRKVER